MGIRNSTLPNTSSNLAPVVFSILDSKIQFLEYQVNIQFDPEKQVINHLTAYEQLMDYYHQKSHSLKLLQILKEWVSEKNASIVFSLLQNDDYLNYSEDQLEQKIQVREIVLIN